MALNYEGMTVTVKDAPSGYTPPAVTTFNDWQYINQRIINVDTSTVQDPDPTTTFTALVGAVDTAVQAKLADFDVVGTVDAYANFRIATIQTGAKYGNDTEVYQCEVDVFVKTAL